MSQWAGEAKLHQAKKIMALRKEKREQENIDLYFKILKLNPTEKQRKLLEIALMPK